jgi:hypothetical protein
MPGCLNIAIFSAGVGFLKRLPPEENTANSPQNRHIA